MLVSLVLCVSFVTKAGAAQEQDNPHGTFREACEMCHGSESWKPAVISNDFDHGARGFSLIGAHARLRCRACHESLDFKKTGSECATCHQDVHRGELGTDCARCHTTFSFIDRADDVRRHRLTRFPLIGAHRALDCDGCHRKVESDRMMYVNTPTECQACHLADYLHAEDPDHESSGFSLDCTRCHSTASWMGARFNHDLTGFALEGAHKGLDCASCHGGNQFGSAQADCVACHQDDYDATTDPVHSTLGFSTDCSSCHDTRSWEGATFDHDAAFFPIYSGSHKDRWIACSDCHLNPMSYAQFSCLDCHAHSDQGRVTGDHDEVSGFVYDSQACLGCHPQGRH